MRNVAVLLLLPVLGCGQALNQTPTDIAQPDNQRIEWRCRIGPHNITLCDLYDTEQDTICRKMTLEDGNAYCAPDSQGQALVSWSGYYRDSKCEEGLLTYDASAEASPPRYGLRIMQMDRYIVIARGAELSPSNSIYERGPAACRPLSRDDGLAVRKAWIFYLAGAPVPAAAWVPWGAASSSIPSR